MGNPLLVINFTVPPEVEPEFNRFYHYSFLTAVLEKSPEIINIRRYEEFGIGGSLPWHNKQYLTIYQLAGDDAMSKVDGIFDRPAVCQVVKEFREWKDRSLRNFSRITYRQTWTHARKPAEGAFAGRPFFLWQLEMTPELDKQFQDWYEQSYLPLQVAEIPTWAGVVRYESVGREPVRHLTFFEANDEAGLLRCLTDLRAAHRIEQNNEWQKRVEPALTWHDATSFRPIFRMPD